LQKTGAGHGRVEPGQRAVAEILTQLASLYRGFVAWVSLYGDTDNRDEQDLRRERVARLLEEFSNGYLARSMWLGAGARKRVKAFISKSESLYSEFSTAIEERGYAQARARMAHRISRELGPLRREAESVLKESPDSLDRSRWRRRPR
jgi:hypothetical protein